MGSSNVSAVQLQKDLNAIKALIKKNDHIFLVCGFDQNDVPHICDFGTQQQTLLKLVDERLRALLAIIHTFFEINGLKKDKPYALKFYVENDDLKIEYFSSLNDLLPTLGKVS